MGLLLKRSSPCLDTPAPSCLGQAFDAQPLRELPNPERPSPLPDSGALVRSASFTSSALLRVAGSLAGLWRVASDDVAQLGLLNHCRPPVDDLVPPNGADARAEVVASLLGQVGPARGPRARSVAVKERLFVMLELVLVADQQSKLCGAGVLGP
jgi:hypothetical protein